MLFNDLQGIIDPAAVVVQDAVDPCPVVTGLAVTGKSQADRNISHPSKLVEITAQGVLKALPVCDVGRDVKQNVVAGKHDLLVPQIEHSIAWGVPGDQEGFQPVVPDLEDISILKTKPSSRNRLWR